MNKKQIFDELIERIECVGEGDAKQAPANYNNDESYAWASGYESGVEAALTEIRRIQSWLDLKKREKL